MKTWKFSALICVLMLMIASSASASLGTVEISYVSNFTDGKMTTWSDGHYGSGYGVESTGGISTFSKDASTGFGNQLNDPLSLGCIEIAVDASTTAPATYEIYACTNNLLSELWGRFYTEALTSAAKAEVFSACIWEIIEDEGDLDVTTWNSMLMTGFKCTDLAASGATLANQWLGSLNGDGPMADLVCLRSDSYQDFVTEVPEPATVSMLGLMSVGFLRRRKK